MLCIDDLKQRVDKALAEIAIFQRDNKGARIPPDLSSELTQSEAAYYAWKTHPPQRSYN